MGQEVIEKEDGIRFLDWFTPKYQAAALIAFMVLNTFALLSTKTVSYSDNVENFAENIRTFRNGYRFIFLPELNTMKKNLLLYILLGFLIVMNGFFLFKHFGTSDQSDRQRPAPGDFIAKQLEFDDAQIQKFESIDMAHREKMNAILEDILESKDALFDKAFDETANEAEIDSIISQIASKEKAKELQSIQFFKSVVEICNENQKVRFKTIIKDALGRQGPPGMPGPPPGGPNGPGEESRPPPPPR